MPCSSQDTSSPSPHAHTSSLHARPRNSFVMPAIKCAQCGEMRLHTGKVTVCCARYRYTHTSRCINCLLMDVDDCCYSVEPEVMVAVESLLLQKAYVDCDDAHAEIDIEVRELLERDCDSVVTLDHNKPANNNNNEAAIAGGQLCTATWIDLTGDDDVEMEDALEPGTSSLTPIDLTLDSDSESDIDDMNVGEPLVFGAVRWGTPGHSNITREHSTPMSPKSNTIGRSESRTLSPDSSHPIGTRSDSRTLSPGPSRVVVQWDDLTPDQLPDFFEQDDDHIQANYLVIDWDDLTPEQLPDAEDDDEDTMTPTNNTQNMLNAQIIYSAEADSSSDCAMCLELEQ